MSLLDFLKKSPPTPPSPTKIEALPSAPITTKTTQTETEDKMSDDIITSENLTKEMLKSLFESAYMEVKLDGDGDIVVKDQCGVFVFPNAERKKIRLMTIFGFKSTATTLQKLEAVNKINSEYFIIRASTSGDTLKFDYDILLDGGLPRKALILILKRFAGIPHTAVQDHASDIVN